MKVLLLKSVPKVGKKDEIVTVADGYAQHALFPKKLAIPATVTTIQARDTRLQQVQSEKKMHQQLLDTTIQQLTDVQVVMPVKANEKGVLFSKIRTSDVVAFLFSEYRIALDENHMIIPEIKKIGTYTITLTDEGYSRTFQITCTAL